MILRSALRSPSAFLLGGLLFLSAGCPKQGGGNISGLVTDNLGQPVAFAKVSVVSEKVLMETAEGDEPEYRGLAVSTAEGEWAVEHLSSRGGEQEPLEAGEYYTVTVYKVGYHPWTQEVFYERGELEVDVILYDDSINIQDTGGGPSTDVEVGPDGQVGTTREGE